MLLRKKKIGVCLSVLLESIILSFGVQAQTALPPDYGQKIGDVVVSVSRAGTELKDMAQNTSILTNEDIQNAPDQTIDQVLKNQSSVFISDQPYYEKDPTGQSLNVRGLGTARTLVLIDGVPAMNPMYGTIEWYQTPLSSIEDVEFIRGGVSNLYGNYGMGGVVNITTKPITGNKGEVSANYGTFNTSNVAASKEFAVNEALKLRVSADAFHTDGYVQYPTISPAKPATYLKGPVGPEYAESRNVRLQGDLIIDSDTTGFFKVGSSQMSNPPSGGYNFATKTTNSTNVSAGTNTKLNADEAIQVNAFYENSTLWQQNVTLGSNPAYIAGNYNNPSNTAGGSVQYTTNLKGQVIDQLILSIDAREVAASNWTNNLCTGTAVTGTPCTTSNPGTVGSIAVANGKQQFYGALGQIKSKLDTIPLEATLSARVDQWLSQVPNYYTAGPSGANPNYTNSPNQSVTKFSPNLGLLYQATKELDFRGAAYQAFHAPGLNNMIRSYGSGTSWSFSNPNLTPENMTGYEIGADYRWGSNFVQITGFNAKITNAIYAAQLPTGVNSYCQPVLGCTSTTTSTLYGNNQSIQSRGLEFQSHFDLTSKLSTDLTYTHTNAVLTWIGATVPASTNPLNSQLGGTPQNMASGSLTYFLLPKTNLTATLRYIGNSWMDTAHAYPVPAYAIVGLRANHEVTQNTTVYLSAVNLLNRNYISYTNGTSAASYIVGQPQTITVGARVVF
jgi:iron complex outermembrane recepter protein